MNRAAALLVGTAAGAGLMYLLDPERARRRRAMVRDQATHSSRTLREAASTTASDWRNRAQGYGASLRRLRHLGTTSDEVLTERVRATLERVCTNPGAIEVTASHGVVTLSGPALAREVPLLIDRILDVRGVKDVVNRLEAHSRPEHIPTLRGVAEKTGARAEPTPRDRSPAARFLAGAAGAGAALYGLSARGAAKKLLGVAGLLLALRIWVNLPLERLTGMRAGRHGVSVHKTVHINAPIEHVFEQWARCESYPNFMSHVQEVRPLEGGTDSRRWHWRVRGASGMEFEFDSTTTAYEPNRFIAWRAEPGALVQHAGQVRFHPNPDRTTTVEVTLSYNPVAGAVGHVIAKLLGDNPKRLLDDDLMRMKTFMETGARPYDAAAAQAPRPVM